MLKTITTRPRLFLCALLMIALGSCLPHQYHLATRLLIAWDCGIALYLASVAYMIEKADLEEIKCRAAEQDEGKLAVLFLTVITAIASIAAIIAELATAKDYKGLLRLDHIGLAALTVFLSWSFMQAMFALHYAHEYYGDDNGKPAKGLDFPGKNEPDYWDFVYYSFVIGTAAQTADVNITSKTIRKITTLHCMIVFFFNTTILALTVNIGSSLF